MNRDGPAIEVASPSGFGQLGTQTRPVIRHVPARRSFPDLAQPTVTQLPAPHRRPPAPPRSRRVRPKTYSVAVYLVVAVVLLQVAMLISVFWLRAMVVSVGVHPPQAQAGTVRVSSPYPVPHSDRTSGPEIPSLPGLETTIGHAARLQVPGSSDKLAQIGTLNEDAQSYLHQNDFPTAADILLKAEDH